MAFSRSAIVRNLRNFRARPTVTRPQLYNQIARRTYASGGHESAKAGGDAVWAAGAVAVTIPTCYFLLQNAPDNSSHGHGDHGDSHEKEEHKEESEDDEKPEEEDKPAESEEKTEDSQKSDDSDSDDDESKGQDTPATSDDESDDGKNVRKSIPDAKGGNKARLESKAAIKQGEGDSKGGEGEPADKAASSKEPLADKNTQSSKQEGLSNTDTKHSTDITNNPDKSQKGEGAPETAKLKGTVDVNRPQV